MADAQEPTVITTAPAASSAPVEITAPANESTSAASIAEPVSSSPVTEVMKADAPITEVKIENPLGDVKTEIKPDEVKASEEKPVEAKVVEPTKVELPTYEAFDLPENVKLEGDNLSEFTKLLAEAETNKWDHKGYQDFGQKLVDYGTKIVGDSINRLNDSYVQIHQQAQKARFEALKADPDLGGEKLPETISSLQRSIAEYGGSEQQISDFRKEVTEAGLGASPAICRLIHNMQQKINKYTTETDMKMLPGAKPAPSKVKDYMKFYS